MLPASHYDAPSAVELAKWSADIDQGGRSHDRDEVVELLAQVSDLNALLSPAANLFEFLRGQDAQSLTDVAEIVGDAWGSSPPCPEMIPALLLPAPPNARAGWISFEKSVKARDWQRVIGSALEINACVMAARGAGPWITAGPDRVLRVRLPGGSELVPRAEVSESLQGRFFIDSLWQITAELAES